MFEVLDLHEQCGIIFNNYTNPPTVYDQNLLLLNPNEHGDAWRRTNGHRHKQLAERQLDAAISGGNIIDETSKCKILMGSLPESWITFVSIHSNESQSPNLDGEKSSKTNYEERNQMVKQTQVTWQWQRPWDTISKAIVTKAIILNFFSKCWHPSPSVSITSLDPFADIWIEEDLAICIIRAFDIMKCIPHPQVVRCS